MNDVVLASTALPGEILADKYRVERIIGSGGMGVVLAVSHVHLRERYALKLLRSSAMSDPMNVERFMREGRAAVKIKSAHVARVFDVGKLADGTPYIVMEYLDGADFAEILEERTRLPVGEAVDFVLEASEAVAEAHALGIVHRDLKPSNLFLTRGSDDPDSPREPTVKVLDFGISKMSSLESSLAMTRTAAIIGSPLYMSPEQLKSARDVDARADVWSLGVILYQLIAGVPPFTAASLPELCALVLSRHVPWLTDAVPDAPIGLARILATCLRPELEDRYRNLADFADAVAAFGTARARASAGRIIAAVGLPADRARPYDRDADLVTTGRVEVGTWSTSPNPSGPAARRRGGWLLAAGGLLAALGVARGLGGRSAPVADDRAALVATPSAASLPSTGPLPPATTAAPPPPGPVVAAAATAPSSALLTARPKPTAPPSPPPARPKASTTIEPPASTSSPAAASVPRSPLGAATSPRD